MSVAEGYAWFFTRKCVEFAEGYVFFSNTKNTLGNGGVMNNKLKLNNFSFDDSWNSGFFSLNP